MWVTKFSYIFFIYINSYNTNYIAFEVFLKQQIQYSIVKIDVIIGVYDLSNREAKKINKIKS